MNAPTINSGYLLLIRNDEWYNSMTADELRKISEQAKSWFERLAAQGKVTPGQGLVRGGAVVGKNGRTLTDGPFAEAKEVIGGYMILQADNLEEAISIAKTNPILAHGSTTIEVRPVAQECPLDARLRELAEEAQLATA
ncbi:MAG TPA: YciI family protein [Verrucomicrobiae bacterium]|jgi:hypothetical protein|nr:YciI family protein [Verrucomicrobiae bacterium]